MRTSMICTAILISIALAFVLIAVSSTSSPLPFLVCPGSEGAPVMLGEKLGLCGGSTRVMNTQSMCLEKISDDPCVSMAAHPDGSDQAFLSTQDGKIWLATVPAHGSALNNGARPVLDLTDRVHSNATAALGLRGVAFHPEFSTNGRFFVAYTCDCDNTSTACSGAGGCWVPDPGNRPRRLRYQLVVAEYRAQGGGLDFSKEPSEVRRISAMGMSQQQNFYSYRYHGGQLLFRPRDSGNGRYLYLITGQEFVSFQNKMSLSSKFIKFDIDRTTPKADDIYAWGVNYPSGCSFDSGSPSDLYCAEVDALDRYEQVYLISETTNGRHSSAPSSFTIVSHDPPAANRTRMPSIVGGLVYRGSADPSLKGRYLYMYGSAARVAAKSSAGGYTSDNILHVRCSRSTPLECRGIDSRVVSFGEDNSKDAYVLATGGVYRVVDPGLCEQRARTSTASSAAESAWLLWSLAVALPFVFYKILSVILADNGGGAITCCSGWFSNWFTTNHNYHIAQP